MQLFRKFLWSIILMILAVAYAGTTLAKEAKMLGTWCSEDGREIMYWEKQTIAFNEHTICEFDAPKATGPNTIMTLECANIYFMDDEIVRAFEKSVLFEANYTAPNRLSVTMDSNPTPTLFTRCYE